MKQSLFTLLIFLATLCQAQIVSTVTQGNFSDGLGIDSQGNVYGSDFPGTIVYKYAVDGTVSNFVTGLTSPNGIGVNPQDEIFICEHFANRIRKYDLDGNLIETFTGFNRPAGIKNIPGTNDMLVVEYQGNRIFRLFPDGSKDLIHSGTPLSGPAGIAFIDTTAYIANFNNRRIFEITPDTLEFVAQLPAGGLTNNFIGFLSAKDGQLIATQIGEGRLYSIDPESGTFEVFAGSTPGSTDGAIAEARFLSPNGILNDEVNNRIYVSQIPNGTAKNLRIIEGLVLSDDEPVIPFFEVNLFPNPVKDSFQIQADVLKPGQFQIRVYDVQGKVIFDEAIESVGRSIQYSIPTTDWSAGAYFIELTNGKQAISKQIIKG